MSNSVHVCGNLVSVGAHMHTHTHACTHACTHTTHLPLSHKHHLHAHTHTHTQSHTPTDSLFCFQVNVECPHLINNDFIIYRYIKIEQIQFKKTERINVKNSRSKLRSCVNRYAYKINVRIYWLTIAYIYIHFSWNFRSD